MGLVAAIAAAPAASADTVAPVARDGVATCLRDAGGGRLTLQGPVTKTSTPTDLLTASPDQIERAAGTDLGNLVECPEVASAGGVTVIAGLAKSRNGFVLRAAVRTGTGAFAAPQTLARSPSYPDAPVVVAVGRRGEAVVAWQESRGRDLLPENTSVRFRVARLAAGPGARFGAPEEVVPWTRQPEFEHGTNGVAAGVDADGRLTVATAVGVRSRGAIGDLSALSVSTAAPGEPLRRTTLVPAAQDVGRISLAVGPDGRALLATTYQEQVHLFERSADGEFSEAKPLGGDEETADEAAIALDPGGAAVVAWRSTTYGDRDRRSRTAIQVARRAPGGSFEAPAQIWSRGQADSGGFIAIGLEDEVAPPLDQARLRAAIAPDGSTAITWIAPRRVAGDRLPAGFVATASPEAPYRVVRLGGPCRSVNGVVPRAGSDPRPGAAWTDNAAHHLDDDLEFPIASGRLHVTDPNAARPAAATPPPGLTLPRSRRVQRLWSEDSIRVPVVCDAPCDLRVFAPDGNDPAVAAGASFAGPGRGDVEVYPTLEKLGLRVRTQRLVVHACSADGTSMATARTTVRVVRNRPPPVPEPVGVDARREGNEVVVSWRTDFPARRTSFTVFGLNGRGEEAGVAAEPGFVEGKGRTRFRVRLPILRGRRVRYVTVHASSTEYSREQHTAVVAVRP